MLPPKALDTAKEHVSSQRWHEARVLLESITKRSAKNIDAWLLLSAVCGALQDYVAAAQCCAHVLSIQPKHKDALYNLASCHLHNRDYRAAVSVLEQLTRLDPRHTSALNNYCYAVLKLKDYDTAILAARNLLAICPVHADAYINLGSSYLGLHQSDKAEQCFGKALDIDPDHPAALYNMGLIARTKSAFADAINYFECAINKRPNYPEAHNNLGSTYCDLGNYEKALSCFKLYAHLSGQETQALENCITCLVILDRLDEAEATCNSLLTKTPDNINAICALASIRTLQRDYDGARRLLAPCLNQSPENPNVLVSYASICHRYNDFDTVTKLLEAASASGRLNKDEQTNIHFTLGHLYDGQQQYDQAFRNISIANSLKAACFSTLKHEQYISDIIARYPGCVDTRPEYSPSPHQYPVFIVGMPRSGTTLVEQILSRHQHIYTAGELPYINELSEKYSAHTKASFGRKFTLQANEKLLLQNLRSTYFDRLKQKTYGKPAITDKMPENYQHLGFINMIFPEARIIHCVRDPRDTCVSCYFQNFAGYLPYAYNLEHLAVAYNQYARLMKHWKLTVTVRMLEVKYEDVVMDIESEVRKILDFCGLDWNQQCVEFHNSSRIAHTASAEQVSRPLYATSVGRWKNYEKHIRGLIDNLCMT